MLLAEFIADTDVRGSRTLVKVRTSRDRHFYYYEISEEGYYSLIGNQDAKLAIGREPHLFYFLRILSEDLKNFIPSCIWHSVVTDDETEFLVTSVPHRFSVFFKHKPVRSNSFVEEYAEIYSQDIYSLTPTGGAPLGGPRTPQAPSAHPAGSCGANGLGTGTPSRGIRVQDSTLPTSFRPATAAIFSSANDCPVAVFSGALVEEHAEVFSQESNSLTPTGGALAGVPTSLQASLDHLAGSCGANGLDTGTPSKGIRVRDSTLPTSSQPATATFVFSAIGCPVAVGPGVPVEDYAEVFSQESNCLTPTGGALASGPATPQAPLVHLAGSCGANGLGTGTPSQEALVQDSTLPASFQPASTAFIFSAYDDPVAATRSRINSAPCSSRSRSFSPTASSTQLAADRDVESFLEKAGRPQGQAVPLTSGGPATDTRDQAFSDTSLLNSIGGASGSGVGVLNQRFEVQDSPLPTSIMAPTAEEQLLTDLIQEQGFSGGIDLNFQDDSVIESSPDRISSYARLLASIENLRGCVSWNACALAEGYPFVVPVGCKIQSAAPEVFSEQLVTELNVDLTNCALKLSKKVLKAQAAMLVKLMADRASMETKFKVRKEDEDRLQSEYEMRLMKPRVYERRSVRTSPIEFFVRPDFEKGHRFVAAKSNPMGFNVAIKLPAQHSPRDHQQDGYDRRPRQYRPRQQLPGSRPYQGRSDHSSGRREREYFRGAPRRYADGSREDDLPSDRGRNVRFRNDDQQYSSRANHRSDGQQHSSRTGHESDGQRHSSRAIQRSDSENYYARSRVEESRSWRDAGRR